MHAAVIEHHVRDLLAARARERQRRRDLLAQRLKRAQQHRQTLALDRLADEQDAQRAPLIARRERARGAIGAGAVELHAVGDHAVAPAVEAPRGPRGGLGDRDPHVQPVHPPRAAERDRGEAVREDVLGVGVEGAEQRQLAGVAQRIPAEQRHDRLVDVHDVIAALAQLAAQGRDRARRVRQVRDGAVEGQADVRPSETKPAGTARCCGRAPRCRRRERVSSGSCGASTRASCPPAASSDASASMWRVTPPGYVHEYGESSAIRTTSTVSSGAPPRGAGAEDRAAAIIVPLSTRHFVKYTFLKLDPAWRRREGERRAQDKREFAAACEDFADGHLLQAFSLVGTRGDAELLLISEAENLDRIHEFHVVLSQSGLMQWAEIPYSFLGMRKSSEYSEDERTRPRGFRGRYVFVYPFVKSREWYALPADERWRIMQNHIEVGREYPGVDNHTSYSFGLDDQEFVVAFDTDDVGTFLDLVQRLRTTEASRFTVRDTPSFTCLAMSLERALNALDGEPVTLEALRAV